MRIPNFYIPQSAFELLRQSGAWHEVPVLSGSLVATFFGAPKTIGIMYSGLDPGTIARPGEIVAVVDWLREELNPRPNEPPVNINRFVVTMPAITGKHSEPIYPVYAEGHKGTPSGGWIDVGGIDYYQRPT